MATTIITYKQASGTDLWGKALEGIKIEHDLDLTQTDRRATLQDILGLVLAAEGECKTKRWKWKNQKGEQIILRDVFTKMTVWIDKFKAVGDVVVQYDPGQAALPWAAVRFILQVAVNDIQTNAAILEGLELVMNLIAKYQTIEILYLRSTSSIKPLLEDSVLKLYIAILGYLIRAHRYFSHRSVARVARSIFQPESTTREFLDNVRLASSNVDQYLPLLAEELQQQSRDQVAELGRDLEDLNLSNLVRTVKSYDAPILRMCSQLSAIEDNLKAEERVKIFEWLTSDEYQGLHRSKYKLLLPGSGRWLLEKPEFTEWQGASSSSILWLHGIPGSGKSMLLAHVIENLKALGSKIENPAPIAFFYCARNANEPERADPAYLMRTILEQLCSSDEDTPIREQVVKAYKDRKKHSRGKTPSPLTLDESVPLILELLQLNPAIIIIDGLDECDPILRQDLLDALTTIIDESSSIVKVLVSSRDDQDLVHHLSRMPNIYIRATENTSDIINFVETRLTDAITKKTILRGNVSVDLKKEIIRILIQKSNGMFRLASLHLETLCNPSRIKTRSNVLSLLSTLPRDLKHSYEIVLNQIAESQQPNPVIADRVIKWLLCARAPLRFKTFLLAVSSEDGAGLKYSKSEVLDICNNLVTFDEETKRFRFVHLSVQEYLLQRNEYSLEQCNAQLAAQCLSWLMSPLCKHEFAPYDDVGLQAVTRPLRDNLDQDCTTICYVKRSVREFTSHVDRHWPRYLQAVPSTTPQNHALSELLESFMLPDIKNNNNQFSFWARRGNFPKEILSMTSYWVGSQDYPLSSKEVVFLASNTGQTANHRDTEEPTNLPVLQFLMGSQTVRPLAGKNMTPLFVAAAFDFIKIVKSILMDPETFSDEVWPWRTRDEPSCATIAARCKSFQVLRYLLEIFCISPPIGVSREEEHVALLWQRRKPHTPDASLIGSQTLIHDYWWQTIISLTAEREHKQRETALIMIFESLRSAIITSSFLRHLLWDSSFTPKQIYHIVPLLFHHNKDLQVESDMLFACYFDVSPGNNRQNRTWYIHSLLIHTRDIVISQNLLELSVNLEDLEFYVILQLLIETAYPIDETVVKILMHYGNLQVLTALKSRPELDIWNYQTAIFLQYDRTGVAYRLTENSLARLLNGRTMKQMTLSFGDISSLLADYDGMATLGFVLEAKPKITPAAINLILAKCDAEVVSVLLNYRSLGIDEQIISYVAQNRKHGNAIMALLLAKENDEVVE